MIDFSIVETFNGGIRNISSWEALGKALEACCKEMGFRYFSANHHIDFFQEPRRGFRLHNYPERFSAYFETHRLWASDPVHRASHMTAKGFRWCEVPDMIELSPRDDEIFKMAKRWGVGEGFTKSAHIQGEARGSVSFAVGLDDRFPEEMLFHAHLISDIAFDAGQLLHKGRAIGRAPKLTPRQLDCVMLVGRGYTDQEIADALRVSRLTVIEHLRNARRAWEVSKSALLPLRAAAAGVLCLSDFFH